jgi:periplasmic copper chaperone A
MRAMPCPGHRLAGTSVHRIDTAPSLEDRLLMRRILLPCGLAVALLVPPGHVVAQGGQHQDRQAEQASFAVGDLVIESPWARESVTQTGAAYLTVRNDGDEDDRLIGVATEVADRAELHASAMHDGIMRMRSVDAVEVPAHGEAVLGPGGLHVMLVGLKAPLEEGGSFGLTLVFENAGEVEVTATVEDIAHGAAGHAHGHGS